MCICTARVLSDTLAPELSVRMFPPSTSPLMLIVRYSATLDTLPPKLKMVLSTPCRTCVSFSLSSRYLSPYTFTDRSRGYRAFTASSCPTYRQVVEEIITSTMVARMHTEASPAPLRFMR